MPGKHSLCSASSAHRWINCPGSVLLTAEMPDKDSPFAAEGTRAHSWAEYEAGQLLQIKEIMVPEPDAEADDEMHEHTRNYAAFVKERFDACGAEMAFLEQPVSYDSFVENGFGTADCLLFKQGHCEVIDFKYGKGVPVDVVDNPQLKLYALGALQLFDSLWEFSDFTLNVFQPRLGIKASWTLSREDLLKWAESEVRPAAVEALGGEGNFKAGEWCQFCKAKATCRQRYQKVLMQAQAAFSKPTAELTEDEIAEILPMLDPVIKYATDVKEYAFQQALNGVQWKGFKLVEGRSVRQYVDEELVAKAVSDAGFDPWEKKLLGITAMTKLLGGAKKFNTILDGLIFRPAGKPVLVPDSDTRNPIKTNFKE